jgi:uncharacterized protein
MISESTAEPADVQVAVPALPFPLRLDGAANGEWTVSDGELTLRSGPRTDLFIDPTGAGEPSRPAGLMHAVADVEGDFQLSAKVSVGFTGAFDAGVLLLKATEDHWAKLCFEISPRGQAGVVSVVTRGTSDDANAYDVDADDVWLRVSRTGSAFAFHGSRDGVDWAFVRHFTLGDEHVGAIKAGFLAQSPLGDGCAAHFREITYVPSGLSDLRDGS